MQTSRRGGGWEGGGALVLECCARHLRSVSVRVKNKNMQLEIILDVCIKMYNIDMSKYEDRGPK